MSNDYRERLHAMATDEGQTYDLSDKDQEAVTWALYVLAHDKFLALRNYGDRWGVAHLSFDGESVAEIFDADFDRLLSTWCDLLTDLEISDPLGESDCFCDKEVGFVCDVCSGRKTAPAECVKCGSATGPELEIDAECPGWLCPACYKAVSEKV